MWPADQSPNNPKADNARERAEADVSFSNSNFKALIKGKKAISRARVSKDISQDIACSFQLPSLKAQTKNQLPSKFTSQAECDGKSQQRDEVEPNSKALVEL